MKSPGFLALIPLVLFAACSTPAARAAWVRDDISLAWRDGTNVVWRFSFDPNKGKPFFHPLTVAGSPSLTNFKPEDHPWHYGLWFSWKYINPEDSTNHINYWEEDRTTGLAQGKTLWDAPVIETASDGSATIRLQLRYVAPGNHVDVTESRTIKVTAPGPDGSYSIHWTAHFVVGDRAVVFDRTPLLGEPDGKVNGGYAGLAFRMAGQPLNVSMLTTAGPVAKFESDRARPNAAATAFNFLDGKRVVGGVAIIPEAPGADQNSPWYLINNATFRFACAAILAPKPIRRAAGEQFDLNYTVVVRANAWTVPDLQSVARK